LNILIIATHGIGDLIMTLPAIRLIENVKNKNVHILLNSHVERQLLESVSFNFKFNILLMEDFKKNMGILMLALILKKLDFDVVIPQSLISKQKVFILLLITGNARLFLSIYKNYQRLNINKHKVYENINSFRFLLNIESLKSVVKYPDIVFSSDVIQRVEEKIDNKFNLKYTTVIIAAGSFKGEKHKRWPSHKYSSLIDKLVRNYQDLHVVVLGGKDEKDLFDSILFYLKSSFLDRVFFSAGLLKIEESLFLIKKSKIVVSNCNSISHMAALIGVDVVGLYGPTDFKKTGPLLNNLYPITLSLSCSPCYSPSYTKGCGNPICMSDIKVDEVYEKVINILN
jgi:ADP-heptose:LPS heptosyltransferase